LLNAHVQHLQHRLVWVTNAMAINRFACELQKLITAFPSNAGMVNARTTQTENKLQPVLDEMKS
jgi:hypothetical protein